jgi:hypothetical protein
LRVIYIAPTGATAKQFIKPWEAGEAAGHPKRSALSLNQTRQASIRGADFVAKASRGFSAVYDTVI